MPVDKFRFLGFLPSKRGQRRQALEDLKDAPKTLVFYEAPHRLLDMLKDARDILGEREVVVAREVTKVHEEFVRGSLGTAVENLKKKVVKGEITVLIGLPLESEAKDAPSPTTSILAEIQNVMSDRQVDERAALKIVARTRGVSKSDAYRLLQAEKGHQN